MTVRNRLTKALAAAALSAALATLAPGAALAADANISYSDLWEGVEWLKWMPWQDGWGRVNYKFLDDSHPDKDKQLYLLAVQWELIQGTQAPAIVPRGQPNEGTLIPGRLEPARQVTRAELATMLSRALDLAAEAPAGTPWWKPHMDALVADGVIPPDAPLADAKWRDTPIPRAEMAVWFQRAAAKRNIPASGPNRQFPDLGGLDPATLDAIHWSVRAGLLKGDANGNFAPNRALTRAEAALTLARLATRWIDSPPDPQKLLEIQIATDTAADKELSVWKSEVEAGPWGFFTNPIILDMVSPAGRIGSFQSFAEIKRVYGSYYEGSIPCSNYRTTPWFLGNTVAAIRSTYDCQWIKKDGTKEEPVRDVVGFQLFRKINGKWVITDAM